MTNVLPPEGTRISPAIEGWPACRCILSPSNQGAITTDVGAHHWRLVGLEMSVPSTIGNTGLIRLGTGYETDARADAARHRARSRVRARYRDGRSSAALSRSMVRRRR
jgi:hypothetical protein